MPTWRHCLLSKSRVVLAVLALFLLLNAFVYNFYMQGRSTAYAINLTTDASATAGPTPDHKVVLHHDSVVNPFRYRFLINQPDICADRFVQLVLAVPVSRANSEKRKTVRETWGSYVKNIQGGILLFFVGDGPLGESPEIQLQIQNESDTFSDIIHVDFMDSYRNLSIKSMSILKWVDSYCPHTKFLTKADDDMYIYVPRLLKSLTQTTKKHSTFILGCRIVGARPVLDKNSKWYTPLQDFSEKQYPVYTSGTSYSMTGDTARQLFQAALRTPLFWLEDIYITGLCSRKAKIPIVDDGTHTYNKPDPNGCSFIKSYTTGHRYNIQQIRKIHSDLQNKNLTCR